MIAADQYTPVDDTLIPTGEIAPGPGHAARLHHARPPIGARIDQIKGEPGRLRPQLRPPQRRRQAAGARRPGARARERAGPGDVHHRAGRAVLHRQLPGRDAQGQGGPSTSKHQGFCLEAQHFPDSVHHATSRRRSSGPVRPTRRRRSTSSPRREPLPARDRTASRLAPRAAHDWNRRDRRPPKREPATSRTLLTSQPLPMKAVAVLPGQAEQRPPARHPRPEADRPAPPARLPRPRGARRCWSRCSRSASTPPTARSTRPSTATPRPGGDHLVIGHESFGQVVEVGDKVTEVEPGDYVSCTVRRPGRLALRQDRPQRHHQRGGLLRARDQPLPRLPDRDVRRRRRVRREGAAEPEAPGRPGRAGERLRQGDRAGVPGPAAAPGLGPEAGVRARRRADRPARHDDAQAPRAGGLHARHQAGAAPQVGDRRGLRRDLRQHPADVDGRPGEAGRQARPDLRGDRQRRGLLPRDGGARASTAP